MCQALSALSRQQRLHVLLTEDKRCFLSLFVQPLLTWPRGLPGAWGWEEEGKGELFSRVLCSGELVWGRGGVLLGKRQLFSWMAIMVFNLGCS